MFRARRQGGKVYLCNLGGFLVVTDTQRAAFQGTGGGCSDISTEQCPYHTHTHDSHNTYIWRVQGHVHTDSHRHTHTHFSVILTPLAAHFKTILPSCRMFFKVNTYFLQSVSRYSTTQCASGSIHLAASCAHTV